MTPQQQGRFTLPGEAGYEDLTLELAKRWGADAIRDSDGTVLSDKITEAGFDIYSTVCMVRMDNAWAKANMDKLQQNYLMSKPVAAEGSTLQIDLLNGYFREQFKVNANDDPKAWWQVFDRTTSEEVPAEQWDFDAESGIVTIRNTKQWHRYTVNFLAYRIWEAISMYNHITNNWGDREHLMPVDPIYPETQEFILRKLQQWIDEHPRTKVVRFTSMFYNFAWFWGDSPRLRYNYSDWGAYDNTVSPLALQKFREARGYALTSEDFVNAGRFGSSHNVPSKRYMDWMDFVNEFVVSFGRKCIDLVHASDKEAFMFYDDHWVGTEPYSDRFKDFQFDGMIKCVFNAFEARKCAGVEHVKTRELRLHPYLFPTGLKGEPTFKEGGNPALDCKRFWVNIRRGLLRAPVDRIGLGGYLHLVQDFPDFVDAVEQVAGEYRAIAALHEGGAPYAAPVNVAVLTAWGKLRSWICSGHFNHGLELNEMIESLAGLPVNVSFISFDDLLKSGVPHDVNVIINCGRAGSAWSGGDHWQNPEINDIITAWVARGGGLIGVAEPSACRYSSQYFQLSHLLGVDRETGQTLSKDKMQYEPAQGAHFILEDTPGELDFGHDMDKVFVTSEDTQVLAERECSPRIATHSFQAGRSLYLSGFKFTPQNTRLLHRALCWAANQQDVFLRWTCSNVLTDCAYYPAQKTLAVINSSDNAEETTIINDKGEPLNFKLEPHKMKVIQS
ncbi:1,3-beta-galactosyl-N-acetylhexosamine phosphorylase [Candidatus Sumerlaeota bacterium]|nr:1,3-beta-galactosyl-N-acetylhexosamine phosphorylase [Candidatus Sumerlaeota bacterium]